MFFRGGLWRFLLTLVLVGVLIAGGVALYQAGFGQGYAAGLAAASGDTGSGALARPPVYGYAPYWFGVGFPFFHPFGILGTLLGIGFFLFVFFLIGRLLFFGGWRRRWAGGERFGHRPYWDRPGEGWPKEGTEKGARTKDDVL